MAYFQTVIPVLPVVPFQQGFVYGLSVAKKLSFSTEYHAWFFSAHLSLELCAFSLRKQVTCNHRALHINLFLWQTSHNDPLLIIDHQPIMVWPWVVSDKKRTSVIPYNQVKGKHSWRRALALTPPCVFVLGVSGDVLFFFCYLKWINQHGISSGMVPDLIMCQSLKQPHLQNLNYNLISNKCFVAHRIKKIQIW